MAEAHTTAGQLLQEGVSGQTFSISVFSPINTSGAKGCGNTLIMLQPLLTSLGCLSFPAQVPHSHLDFSYFNDISVGQKYSRLVRLYELMEGARLATGRRPHLEMV
jgi:hypothetical protein